MKMSLGFSSQTKYYERARIENSLLLVTSDICLQIFIFGNKEDKYLKIP